MSNKPWFAWYSPGRLSQSTSESIHASMDLFCPSFMQFLYIIPHWQSDGDYKWFFKSLFVVELCAMVQCEALLFYRKELMDSNMYCTEMVRFLHCLIRGLSPWWCHHGSVDSVSICNHRSQWCMTNKAGAHRLGGVGVSPCSFSQSGFQSSNIPLAAKDPVRNYKQR